MISIRKVIIISESSHPNPINHALSIKKCARRLGPVSIHHSQQKEVTNLLASICLICGNASRILFLYNAGLFNCNGFPSKYTVSSFFLSLNSRSTSSKLDNPLLDAQTSSSSVSCEIPSSFVTLLFEKSRTRRFLLFSKPERSVSALWEM